MAALEAGPLRTRRDATAKRAHPLGADIPGLQPKGRKQLCEQMLERSQEYAEPGVKGRKRFIHQFTMTGRVIRFLCQIAHIFERLFALQPIQPSQQPNVSNSDQQFLPNRAIMEVEMSISAPSFRSSELSQSI